MDANSQHVITFLQSLQAAMLRLGEIQGHYIRHGAEPERPSLLLSGSPFGIHTGETVQLFGGCITLGLMVCGRDGRMYELFVEVLWDAGQWTILTEARVDNDEDDGSTLLRALPDRVAGDLDGCVSQLGEAVEDLAGFVDLVPGK
jgi:hypothetical protein